MEIGLKKIDLRMVTRKLQALDGGVNRINRINNELDRMVRKFKKVQGNNNLKHNHRWGWVNLLALTEKLSEARSEVERKALKFEPHNLIGTFFLISDMREQYAFSLKQARSNYGSISSFLGYAVGKEQEELIMLALGGISNFFFFDKGMRAFTDHMASPAESIYVAAGWAKAVWYLWAIRTRNIVLISHSHENGKCPVLGTIRCDELPEDDSYIGLVPIDHDGWPVLP